MKIEYKLNDSRVCEAKDDRGTLSLDVRRALTDEISRRVQDFAQLRDGSPIQFQTIVRELVHPKTFLFRRILTSHPHYREFSFEQIEGNLELAAVECQSPLEQILEQFRLPRTSASNAERRAFGWFVDDLRLLGKLPALDQTLLLAYGLLLLLHQTWRHDDALRTETYLVLDRFLNKGLTEASDGYRTRPNSGLHEPAARERPHWEWALRQTRAATEPGAVKGPSKEGGVS